MNFIGVAFLYTLIHEGIDASEVGRGWTIGIAISVFAIWMAYWKWMYNQYQLNKKDINK